MNNLELTTDFFEGLLKQYESLFENKQVSIVECKQHSDGKIVYALAATLINPVTQLLEFTPIAFLWDKNPKMSMTLTNDPIMASQKSMDSWAKEANLTIVSSKTLN